MSAEFSHIHPAYAVRTDGASTRRIDHAGRRAELFSNPDWLRYIAETGSVGGTPENRILTAAPFFEGSIRAMLTADKVA